MTTDSKDPWQDIISGVSLTDTTIPTPSYTIGVGGPAYTYSNITWSPNTWTTTDTISIGPLSNGANLAQSGKLSLKGDDADIDVNGVSLMATLKRIEERINLLTVNAELEAEWEDLRELGEQYRALEQRIKDKMETWKKLNAQDRENR